MTALFLYACGLCLGATQTDDPLERGLNYLVSAQSKDGSFIVAINNNDGERNPRCVCSTSTNTGFAVLAVLARGEARYDAVAYRGLQFLTKDQALLAPPRVLPTYAGHYEESEKRSHTRSVRYVTYELLFESLALVEGASRWKEDFGPTAKKAVQFILDVKYGCCSSTAKAALTLQVFWSARRAGLHVPDAAIKYICEFIHKRFNDQKKLFLQHFPDLTGYGATGMAVATLEQLGEKDSKIVTAALSSMGTDPDRTDANDRHFQWLGKSLAFRHARNPKFLRDWLPAVRKKLIRCVNKDGSWNGLVGKTYGTATACLILQMDQEPRLNWLQPCEKSKKGACRPVSFRDSRQVDLCFHRHRSLWRNSM